ncbi:GFA family protein [Shewanella sp.]|uniref:GFA family protein n=1 Tax=Shewanella sp. TaxID=50422 RepID=UPI003A96BA73
MPSQYPLRGQCDCGYIQYQINCEPLVVHCCHCSWCRRETGSAFAINAMIEADQVQLLSGEPVLVNTPSNSGKGQQIARCPHCHVALWSHYAGSGPLTKFVRVGTLVTPEALPPDVHIFTADKLPWVLLPQHVAAFEIYYDRDQVWRENSLQRWQQLLPKIAAWRATQAH